MSKYYGIVIGFLIICTVAFTIILSFTNYITISLQSGQSAELMRGSLWLRLPQQSVAGARLRVLRPYEEPVICWWIEYHNMGNGRWVIVPLWIPALIISSATTLFWLQLALRGRKRRRTHACPKCSYSMSGLSAKASCPECGHRPSAEMM